MKFPMRLIMALSVVACVAGSGAIQAASSLPALEGGGPALTKRHYSATVTSSDGTPIAITVFVPNAPANTPVPLILMHPGWAVPRSRQLFPTKPGGWVPPLDFPPQVAATMANDNGYYVISFDERGFYQSGGVVMIGSPDYEGRDITAILDWAEANLGPQLARRDGKLVSGSLGLSYGGGTQLLSAIVDPRVTAIVPTAGWYSLASTLLPNGVPKSNWISILYWSSVIGSGNRLDPRLTEAFKQQKKGSVDQALIDSFAPNGLQAYCDGTQSLGVPHVSAFIVQGESDTLFNMNQGVASAECLRAAGNDVRLLIQQYGHSLPSQKTASSGAVSPQIIFSLEKQVQCGSQNFDVTQAMFSFFEEKIRGVTPPISIPENCITLDATNGLTPTSIPRGNVTVTIPGTQTSTKILATSRRGSVGTDAVAPPTWVPLYTTTSQRPLAGIPHIVMDIAASSLSQTPFALVGIGLKRAASSTPVLIDDQIQPFRGAGHYDQDLIGIAELLQAGDTVGLLVYGHDPQYANDSPSSTVPASFSGTLALPLP